ncbi:MAG: acylphosphatase [Planctomycetota bacterium]
MTPSKPVDSTKLRRRVFFSGRVQGVGFRTTADVMANRYYVTGFVRNLKDGRVELVAEGTKSEVDAFVTAVHNGMMRYIEQVEVLEEAATGEFKGFGVGK